MRGERREESRTAIWRPPAGGAHLIRTATIVVALMCCAFFSSRPFRATMQALWLQKKGLRRQSRALCGFNRLCLVHISVIDNGHSRLSSTTSLGNHMSNFCHPLISCHLRLSVTFRNLGIVYWRLHALSRASLSPIKLPRFIFHTSLSRNSREPSYHWLFKTTKSLASGLAIGPSP